MTTIDTVVAVPLQAGYQGPTYRDLTVVAILATDPMLVVVPAASAFRTIGELVEHARHNPGRLKLATNAAGGEDHIFGGMIERATGARFSYVHTKGGAEAMNENGTPVDLHDDVDDEDRGGEPAASQPEAAAATRPAQRPDAAVAAATTAAVATAPPATLPTSSSPTTTTESVAATGPGRSAE